MRFWTQETAEPSAKPLFAYLRANGRWSGFPSELLELLRAANPDRSGWWRLPGDTEELASLLNYLRSAILRHGFGYKPHTFTGTDRITLYPQSPQNRAATRRNEREYQRKVRRIGQRGY